MKLWRTFLMCTIPVTTMAQDGPKPDTISPQIASHAAGVICAQPTAGIAQAPGTVAGTTHLIDIEPAFVSTTRRVPAVTGIGFGIKSTAVDISGIPDVTITVTHPPMGKQRVTSQSFDSRISGSESSLTFYQFDFAYELVTGFWQMEAANGSDIIYRTTFEVLPPDQMPELASICGFENLLS